MVGVDCGGGNGCGGFVNGGLVAAVAAATAAIDFHHFCIENQDNSFFLQNLLQ